MSEANGPAQWRDLLFAASRHNQLRNAILSAGPEA